MKIKIASVNWPLVVICVLCLAAGPLKVKMLVGASVALSAAATWVAYAGVPAFDRWLLEFRTRGQPRERISVVGVETHAKPATPGDTFGVLDPVTGRHLFVPVGRDLRRLALAESGEVVVATNRLTGDWVVLRLAPPG